MHKQGACYKLLGNIDLIFQYVLYNMFALVFKKLFSGFKKNSRIKIFMFKTYLKYHIVSTI